MKQTKKEVKNAEESETEVRDRRFGELDNILKNISKLTNEKLEARLQNPVISSQSPSKIEKHIGNYKKDKDNVRMKKIDGSKPNSMDS